MVNEQDFQKQISHAEGPYFKMDIVKVLDEANQESISFKSNAESKA